MILKIDPYTSTEFFAFRCNQRFSSKKNRIAFHNLSNNEFRRKMDVINKPLMKNLKILDELFLSNKRINNNSLIFHKEFMLGRNYDFTKHTHYDVFEGQKYIACYNYIIIHLDKEKVKIIKTSDL